MTPTMPGEMHPNDVCTCGDYRHQHKDGVGRCKMPDDLCHGFRPCLKFNLASPAARPAVERKERENG